MQRFIKPPPASEEWQMATRKKKNSVRTRKRCYFCHKQGHLQKHCWKRIKCFNCGKNGHKYENCLFKRPKTPNRNNTNRSDSIHHTVAQQFSTNQHTVIQQNPSPKPSAPHMEPIHGRPPLGDIFCCTRQALDDDNDYLSSIGLITLIRGSPSPDLPRRLAVKLASVNGGHQQDYVVSEAVVTPYIVACPNSQIRNTIVQQGLYSIPQIQVQFTVHEWRPRFGMDYNPPTHQTWVKIVGLPLQAWSTPEITRILQKIGHPLQIRPFGRDAGHHRDITALIATMDPSHIPLAYTYREGEYSAHVNIFILSCRLREDGYFPLPDNPPSPGVPQTQQQGHAGWESPDHLSSHPSSSATPSEPTIHLSSWSPRSYRLLPQTTQISTPKAKTSFLGQGKKRKDTDLAPQARTNRTSVLLSGHPSLRLSLHESLLALATGNQTKNTDALGFTSICSPIRLDLLSIPSHIHLIPPHCLTQTTHACTLRQSRSIRVLPTEEMGCSLHLLQEVETLNSLSLLESSRLSSPKSLVYIMVGYINEYASQLEGPIQPKALVCKQKELWPSTAHCWVTLPSHLYHPLASLLQPISPSLIACTETQSNEQIEFSDITRPSPPGTGLLDPNPSERKSDPEEQQGSTKSDPISEKELSDPSDPSLTLQTKTASLSITPLSLQATPSRMKRNQPPTRRIIGPTVLLQRPSPNQKLQ